MPENDGTQARFDALIDRAAEYQKLAMENYDRVRRIADGIQKGFCAYLAAKDGVCVRLVPPFGPFQPKEYGDEALSMPPRGFRHIAPIAFGLAVRVTRGTDWLRMVVTCAKQGDSFDVSILDGPSQEFALPFGEDDHQEFYELLYRHVLHFLDEGIRLYEEGLYGGSRTIGFDLSDEHRTGDGLAPDIIKRPAISPIAEEKPKEILKPAAKQTNDTSS